MFDQLIVPDILFIQEHTKEVHNGIFTSYGIYTVHEEY